MKCAKDAKRSMFPTLVYCSPSLSHNILGVIYPWILSKVYHSLFSKGKTLILVVVDRFTKYGHSFALAHPFSASTIANLFLDNIYQLHGMPQSIVSKRDRIFFSAFWQGLFKLLGTELHLSSAYHPQTNGQTERLNQCLEMYQRCMTFHQPRQWIN